ncbi:MAG: NPCBM/NEW2 domain-containing protein [Armatimonadetes bacterium]|nr:NPCBM/NEW2 domain-containing protein [Armatimonadota bacterium]
MADRPDESDFNRRWAEQVFSEVPPASVSGNRLTVVHEGYPGDTKVGRGAAGGPIRLGDKVYRRGIGVNSHSAMRVSLVQPAERFRAMIGLDRNVDGTVASVAFHVVVGGTDVFSTEVMRPSDGIRDVDVQLNGASAFDLIVDEGGDGRAYDQADWVEARVILQDGSQVWLDDLARQATLPTDLPFSFVYGGELSSNLLRGWQHRVEVERIDGTRLCRTLTLTDTESGLEVRAVATIYTDTPGVDWTLYFTNKGPKETPILQQVKAVDVSTFPGLGTTPVLHRLRGSTCAADDWLPFDEALTPGKKIEFGAVNGRSSADSPFFNLDWGSGGVITAIGWSGQWRGSVEQEKEGVLRIRAGMENLNLRLRPGETIRSPRILQLYWLGNDPSRGCNLFRQAMLRHITPKVHGKPRTPPIAHLSTSFYELNNSTEENVLSHLEALRGLGFEMFWLDAYWTKDGFPAGMGHYGFPIERVEPRDRFPRGLKPITEAAHREGMGFLMWFEPERVHPGTELSKEHPEWVLSPGNDGSGLFNLGIPEAREYMTRYLKTVIKEYSLDCLRIDFNIDPLPFWEFLNRQDPDRVGLGEIRYVEGLYRMWDDILAANPHLFIDNCASGGRRIDLETCSRSIPLWRSDNTCDMLDHNPETVLWAAIKNQLMSAGLNRYLPFSTVGQMGATPYLFRSGFNAGIAFAEDCRPREYRRNLLKQAIAEGKRLRKYYFGNFHPLSDVTLSAKDWSVLQYHRPAEEDGIIVAFRRHQSPYGSFHCQAQEIDAEADYEVTWSHTYNPSKAVRVKGAKLRSLKLEIEDCPGSVVVEYRQVSREGT